MTDEIKPEPNRGYLYDWLHLTEAQAYDMSRKISAGILLTNTVPELLAYLKLDRLPEMQKPILEYTKKGGDSRMTRKKGFYWILTGVAFLSGAFGVSLYLMTTKNFLIGLGILLSSMGTIYLSNGILDRCTPDDKTKV
jgi:hypothetical protein